MKDKWYLGVLPQEEEESSDEEHAKQQQQQLSLRLKPPSEELRHLPPQDMSETPLVSPLEEVKGLQPQIVTMATLHEASRYVSRVEDEMLQQLTNELGRFLYYLWYIGFWSFLPPGCHSNG